MEQDGGDFEIGSGGDQDGDGGGDDVGDYNVTEVDVMEEEEDGGVTL
jgi:hypothetical protein